MRPYIICHMFSSIDGRLHPSRYTVPVSGVSAEMLDGLYYRIAARLESEGWIVGRKTMAELYGVAGRGVTTNKTFAREPHIGDRGGRDLAVAIDPSGRVHYGQDNIEGDHIVAVLGEQVSDDYLAELREDGVSYIFAGRKGDDLPSAMAQLANLFGVKRLLLEGGGIVNGSFLKHRLIDEFSTLIYSAVDGLAGTDSIIDYPGEKEERPGQGQSLRLIGCEVLDGGMVWLRHAVEDAPTLTTP